MEVSTGIQLRSKRKYLAFTVTITKPHGIQLYLVKANDKGDLKKLSVCNAKSLKKLDCRETKTQPSYDLQLTTDNKTWIFSASKLEEKHNFVSTFCRVLASLQPMIYKEIALVNVPPDLNISAFEQNESLELLLNPQLDSTKDGKSDEQGKIGDGKSISEAYKSLTTKEEEDIRQFLDELDKESVMCNAAELTELLQEQLAHVEGTNIHSIMASEAQVLKLMSTLDMAIARAENLEKQLNNYHQFLEDVDEAMSSLHDHDQLVQTTVDNRARLLQVLENLVSRMSLDAKSVRALMEVDLINPSGVAICTEAARSLDTILNSGMADGEQHLRAVEQRMDELKRLRDSFATKLAGQVNDNILRFASQLGFILSTNSTSVQEVSTGNSVASQLQKRTFILPPMIRLCSELYDVQRKELLQLGPLVGTWLQKNRKDIFIGLKRMYVQKLQQFSRRQVQELFNTAQQSIFFLLRPSRGGPSQRSLESIPVDTGSVMSLHCPAASVLTEVQNIFDECLKEILRVIRAEQLFVAQFFGFRMDQPTNTRPYNPSLPLANDELTNLSDCMYRLFDGIDIDAMNFLALCEQSQPALVMPLLITTARTVESIEFEQSRQASAKQQSSAQESRLPILSMDPTQLDFISNFLWKLTVETKRAFNRHIERLIYIFKGDKPSKKSRCGILRMVRTYIEFAECSMVVFANSSRLVDLERAHGELVRALMTQIERVASESVKTPREVVQLENYHRLRDILRRLKLPGLEEHHQEAKNRYLLALQEYTKNCMGRPLEKLASFFENVQIALDSGVRPEVVSYQFAFSKQELQKVIREYPGKEVKRGLENLCKKVEKHLSDEENLFPVVWRSIQTEFITQCLRFSKLIEQCYPDSQISLGFTVNDLQTFFTDISRSR